MKEFIKNKFTFSHKISDKPTQSSFFKHIHPECELLYFVDGDADYIVEDKIFSLKKNDLLLIKPLNYHFIKLKSGNFYERFVINFSTDDIDSYIRPQINEYPCLFNLPDLNNYFIEMLKFSIELTQEDAFFAIKNMLNIILVKLKIQSNHDATCGKIISPLFSKILKFIDDNISHNLNLTILSETFFVSQSWITHSFKKFFGISTLTYINYRRITGAQKMVKNGLPLNTVIQQYNFSDYSTFYRQYKKFLGTNPEEDKPKPTNQSLPHL